jgi:hypothetical protein
MRELAGVLPVMLHGLRGVVVLIHSHPAVTLRHFMQRNDARPSRNSITVSSCRHDRHPITFPANPPTAEPKERNLDHGGRHNERKPENPGHDKRHPNEFCIHDRASMT